MRRGGNTFRRYFFIFLMATPFSIEIKPVLFLKYYIYPFKGQQEKIMIPVWSPTELELN